MKSAHIFTIALVFLTSACSVEHTASTVKDNGTDNYGWCHSPQMMSTAATNLTFDYQVSLAPATNGSSVVRTSSVNPWISVSKFGFQGNESVRVVFMTNRISTKGLEEYGPSYKDLIDTQTLQLTWDAASQKYSGQPAGSPYLGSYYVGDDQTGLAIYEYAIEVNGEWQTDPISGGHNFQFMPMKQAQGFCQGQQFYIYN